MRGVKVNVQRGPLEYGSLKLETGEAINIEIEVEEGTENEILSLTRRVKAGIIGEPIALADAVEGRS